MTTGRKLFWQQICYFPPSVPSCWNKMCCCSIRSTDWFKKLLNLKCILEISVKLQKKKTYACKSLKDSSFFEIPFIRSTQGWDVYKRQLVNNVSIKGSFIVFLRLLKYDYFSILPQIFSHFNCVILFSLIVLTCFFLLY